MLYVLGLLYALGLNIIQVMRRILFLFAGHVGWAWFGAYCSAYQLPCSAYGKFVFH
jgi:uncharacterized protein YaaW (UPF0174 family)